MDGPAGREVSEGAGKTEVLELRLQAPFWFDQTIGYWTGERDLSLLHGALAAVAAEPGVQRRVQGGVVQLAGTPDAVRSHAAELIALGLEPSE